jgi:hypothetical protein
MKIKFISTLIFSFFVLLILQSVSAGRAFSGGQDRTGSPGSLSTSSTCNACHSIAGAFTNPQIAVSVKDLTGNSVTSYTPGDTFDIEYTITSGGTPSGYGMQSVFLNSANSNIGDIISTSTSNTQLASITNGREFIEHSGRSSTGVFSGQWVAPSTGTGTVSIYSVGIAVNGGSTSGDNVTPSTKVDLTEAVVSSTENLTNFSSEYLIFPVPNNGNFSIRNNGDAGTADIRIINMQGQLVFSKSTFAENDAQIDFNLNEIVDGLYFVEILKNGTSETLPFIVN